MRCDSTASSTWMENWMGTQEIKRTAPVRGSYCWVVHWSLPPSKTERGEPAVAVAGNTEPTEHDQSVLLAEPMLTAPPCLFVNPPREDGLAGGSTESKQSDS